MSLIKNSNNINITNLVIISQFNKNKNMKIIILFLKFLYWQINTRTFLNMFLQMYSKHK